MKRYRVIANLISLVLALAVGQPAIAEIYQFKFSANPDALDVVQDKSLDVAYAVTLDSTKITAFNATVLNSTNSWLNGGITMTMSYGGKTVTLNDAFDPMEVHPTVPGRFYNEGFLDLASPFSPWFFALEFAPGNSFIDKNMLPYDPFVYGFLFVYQSQQPYLDFRQLWTLGQISVLPTYQVASVPEPGSILLLTLGLGALSFVARRQAVSRRPQP